MSEGLRIFNAFQAVSMFAAMPFGLSWVSAQDFKGASIAFWVGVIIYIIAFLMNVGAVLNTFEKD